MANTFWSRLNNDKSHIDNIRPTNFSTGDSAIKIEIGLRRYTGNDYWYVELEEEYGGLKIFGAYGDQAPLSISDWRILQDLFMIPFLRPGKCFYYVLSDEIHQMLDAIAREMRNLDNAIGVPVRDHETSQSSEEALAYRA
jgi:hypothetical protein